MDRGPNGNRYCLASSTRRADLTDRVVLVTEGSAGIRYATARRLAERGANVVITARNTPRLRSARVSLVTEIGRPVDSLAAEPASPEERDRIVPQVIERQGGSTPWSTTPHQAP